MTPRPWTPGEGGDADKRHAPATLRNRDAIAAVLAGWLPPTGTVLEVASGSGEHAVHFAAAFPRLRWQPSDPDAAALASIAAWSAEAALANIAPPLRLDAAAADWLLDRAGAILCINMVHISPWAATVGLFMRGAKLLKKGAPLILYGPYFRKDYPTAPSNVAFDESLRARDAEWGVRWLEDVTEVAEAKGFELAQVREMPANNLMLLYRLR
ncbi:MAG: SAM-dependent methyltransferase [Alphaproteobacteria bacterium HGW-Alphaproteobacteria-13]|nr:MAG: SAM-dependent methyltransferase [Alphaproteobacteria bacterium HGW-Alphaproteobacteria-13]